MTERIEIRDGREFVVTEIPPVEPRRRAKGMMTKRMARGAAVGKQLGAGPPTQLKVTKPRRFVSCTQNAYKCGWIGIRLAETALAKPCPHCGHPVR